MTRLGDRGRWGVGLALFAGLCGYLIAFQGGFSDWLTFTILGITTGAIYAIAASGLVVTYTTSGIFNFAQGAFGMLGAFAYWQLRFDWGWPAPVALAVILLVVAPLFGAVVERVIMRGLEGVSEITSTVVTIGLLAMAIGIANIVWPPAGRRVDQFFAGNSVTLGAINVTWHRMVIVVVAVLVAVGLRFLLYRTRSGVAMRAVVDDRALSQLNGGNPGRSAMVSWGIGSSLAALSGILISPLLQLSVLPLTLLIVNAYAAAMFGRLRSLPLTFAGGLIIGIAENYSSNYLNLNTTEVAGVSLAGLQPALPVILLFVILIALPSERLRTGGVQRVRESARVPTMRSAVLAGGALIVVTVAASRVMSTANVTRFSLGLATAVIILSLVPLVGYGGQISLAVMTFAGLGAFAMVQVADGPGPLVGLVAAAGLAAAVGAVIALPALRLAGIYLALATAAFAVFMENFIFTQSWFFGAGSIEVPRPDFLGLTFEDNRSYLVLLSVLFSLLGILVIWLRRGPFGRRLQAMKDSPAACATLGLDLTRTKVAVFAFSAGIAGVGGALFGGVSGSVSKESFLFAQSLPILLMGVVGGIALVSGALLGGLLLQFFSTLGENFTLLASALFLGPLITNFALIAPGLIGILLSRNPDGLAADLLSGLQRATHWVREGRERPEEQTGPDPLMTAGLERPLSSVELAAVDAALGLDPEEIAVHGAARG